MTLSEEFIKLTQCPVERTPLSLATDDLVTCLNRAIADGQIVSRGGAQVAETVEGGLVNERKSILYAIRDRVPNFIVDEAIDLSQLRL